MYRIGMEAVGGDGSVLRTPDFGTCAAIQRVLEIASDNTIWVNIVTSGNLH